MAHKNVIEIIVNADDKASKKFRTISVNTQELGRRVASAAKIMAAAGVTAGAALVGIVSKTSAWGDKIAKSAKQIGVTTEFLSEMEHTAKISGASHEDVMTGIKRMSKAASDASYGMVTYQRSFDALGISVTDNEGKLKDSEALFMEIAEAMSKVDNDTQKAALAQELFGRGGLRLIPLLNRGKSGIRELRLEAKRLGVSLAGEDAEKMEEFQDAVTNIKDAVKGLSIAITSEYGPAMIKALDKVTEYISEIGETKRELKEKWESGEIAFGKPFDPKKIIENRERIAEEAENVKDIVADMHRAITAKIPAVIPFTIAAPPTPDMSPYLESTKEMKEAEEAHAAALAKEEEALQKVTETAEERFAVEEERRARAREEAEGWEVDYSDTFAPAILDANRLRKSIEGATEATSDLSMELEDVPDLINRAADAAESAREQAERLRGAFDYSGEDIAMDLTNSWGNALEIMLSDARDKTKAIEKLFANMGAYIIAQLAKAAFWKLIMLPAMGLQEGAEIVGAQRGLEYVGAEGLRLNIGAQHGLEAVGGRYMRDTIPVSIGRGEVVSPAPFVEEQRAFMERVEAGGGGTNIYINSPFTYGSLQQQLELGTYVDEGRGAIGKFEIEGTL